jgi:hypothetical protein
MTKSKTARPRKNAAASTSGSTKDGKRQEFVKENTGMRLLGEVITWNPGKTVQKHLDIKQALIDAGLNVEVARELLPRHAFTRATKKLSEERVIDAVNDTNDTIKFQFTKRFMEENEWKYEKECYLLLDKQLGKIACDNKTLEQAAQVELDKAMENRTSADVTKMIQKLFDAEADLFPIRDQGGVYFVPDKFSSFTDKIDTFVSKLGGRVSRFPVPADTKQGDKSVQDSIINGLSLVMADHEEAVDGFGIDTRHDTLERAAEKIKQTRVKIEAYAEYLKDRRDELLLTVDEANKKLVAKVQQISTDRANAPATSTNVDGGNRAYIFSYSVTAVIRWMGKDQWGFKQARKVVDAFVGEGKISDATIRAQLLGGRNNERGDPANLTDEQVKQLKEKLVELETEKSE